MADLLNLNAKICLTAAGILIHQNKVLLVKHKKLGIWLNPGGHLEANEVPHQAAEREFWEETSIRVRAINVGGLPRANDDSQYLPNPIATNLHWVSEKNYQARLAHAKTNGTKSAQLAEPKWERGCEQHLGLVYLVEPIRSVEFKENVEESDGIAWFSREEVETIETVDNVRSEIRLAFEILQKK